MPSTYHLYDRYGQISPTFTGETWLAKCKYSLAPVVSQATNNRIFAADATADYSTFNLTGIVGFYDAQNGVYGVGSARYMLDGTSLSPNIKFPSASYYNTSTNSYKTASLRVKSDHALQLRLDIQLQDSGGTQVGGTDSTSVTLVPGKWTNIAVTSAVNGVRFLMTLNIINFNATNDTGKIFFVDSVQVEDNRYQTPFVNAPARAAGTLNYNVPKMTADYTALCWTVAGPQVSSAAGGTHPFFTLYADSSSYATLNYQRGSTKLQAFKDDTDPNTDLQISSLTVEPGTLMFGALVHSGTSMTAYFAKDGDASLQTVSGNTDFEYFETVYLGQDPVNSYWANGPIENFLLFNRALTESEILSIFQDANGRNFSEDKSIILAAATPTLVGNLKAESITGTGSYRYLNSTASLDIIPAINLNNAAVPSETSSHVVFGADVDKLNMSGVISTSTNLEVANLYRVDKIIDIPTAGKSAFVSKL
jgi:hypothetical protein